MNHGIKLARAVAVCGALFYGLNCGTLIDGRSHEYEFTSTPAGAQVTVYIVQSGVMGNRSYGDHRPIADRFPAPGSTTIKMDSVYVVEFELAGYKNIRMTVGKEFNYVSILNLWFWPCWLVDVFAGGIYVPENDGKIWVELKADPGTEENSDEAPTALQIGFRRGSGPVRFATVPLTPGDGRVDLTLTPGMLR